MPDEDLKKEYVKAILEGRFSTASYLYPDIEEVWLEDFLIAPWWERERFQVKGEIVSS